MTEENSVVTINGEKMRIDTGGNVGIVKTILELEARITALEG